MIDLKKDELNYIQKYVSDACGLVLSDEKEYLIRCRLGSLLEQHELEGFDGLVDQLKMGHSEIGEQVVTELTTHETYFFRDTEPFKAFRSSILPWLEEQIIMRKNKEIVRKGSKASIWCAAASTGQEPYSLAMLVDEYIRHSSIEENDVSIMATDVSSDVLAFAMQGRYRNFDFERGAETPFDLNFRRQFFKQKGDEYEVNGGLKQMVDFKYCNLVQPFAHLGGFDVIFCRNVLIYFTEEDKSNILEQFYYMLSPGGYLVLGASEHVSGLNDKFESKLVDDALIYQKI